MIARLTCLVLTLFAAGWCSAQPKPAPVPADSLRGFAAPETSHSLAIALADIQANVAKTNTLSCTLELSKKRDKKTGRKTRVGPLELLRGQGARLVLTRKGETDEYIANEKIIWVYDVKRREAKYIPTDLPIIGYFVQEALKLNVLPALDAETMKLKGTESVDGEPCWVIEGKSPNKLRAVGVSPSVVRVWVSRKDGIPRMIKVPVASDCTIRLHDIAINVPVAKSRFDWTPPSNVKTKNIFGF